MFSFQIARDSLLRFVLTFVLPQLITVTFVLSQLINIIKMSRDMFLNAVKKGRQSAEKEKKREEEQRSRVQMMDSPAKDPAKVGGYVPRPTATLSQSSSSSDSSDSSQATPPKRSSPIKKKISGGSRTPPSTGPKRALSSGATTTHISRTVTLKVRAKEGPSTSREKDIVRNVSEPARPRCLYVVHEKSTNETRFVSNCK